MSDEATQAPWHKDVAILCKGNEQGALAIHGDMPKKDCRVLSEPNYQLALKSVNALPDLLAALVELEVYMTECGYFRHQEEMAKRVRAAIRKARG